MRVIPILLLAVALATSSGCFGKDDEPTDATPTSPTGGTGTTPTSPTGTTPTTTPASPTTPTTPTTPAKPAPRELCAANKDFTQNTPDPTTQSAVSSADCGTVTAGYTKITLSGNFTAGTPPVAGPGIVVKVLDSTGAVAASCNGPPPGPVTAATACAGEGTAAAGAYTLQYEGTGSVMFAGSVQIS